MPTAASVRYKVIILAREASERKCVAAPLSARGRGQGRSHGGERRGRLAPGGGPTEEGAANSPPHKYGRWRACSAGTQSTLDRLGHRPGPFGINSSGSLQRRQRQAGPCIHPL